MDWEESCIHQRGAFGKAGKRWEGAFLTLGGWGALVRMEQNPESARADTPHPKGAGPTECGLWSGESKDFEVSMATRAFVSLLPLFHYH